MLLKMWWCLLIVIFASSLPGPAQTAERYYGKLHALSADTAHIYQRVFSAPPTDPSVRFSPSLEKGSAVSRGELIDDRTVAGKLAVFLVEPPGNEPYLCFDLDANGVIEKAERFELRPAPGSPNDLDASLLLPIDNALFKAFPVFVRYKRGFAHPKLAKTDRLLLQSVWAHALGTVGIDGRSVLFQYPFDPKKPAISTTEGLFGVDADGDGRIRNEQFSPETSYAANDELVFRLGDLFLSTSSVDLAKNEIVVRRRDPQEYLRVELEVGKAMPDFTFTDFEGKQRRLAEFRGKYVLIDFWGVWCVDCLRETPFQVAAYQRFRSRGFEILGLNWDDKIEDARGFLAKSKASWTQARKESIRTLTEVTYRIQEYPSTILLGPDGKVLVLDQDLLRGETLLRTLDEMIK